MNSLQVPFVQRSVALAAPIAATLADRFYAYLFTPNSSLRPLVGADHGVQKKPMPELPITVASQQMPDRVLPTLQMLGQRHSSYGIQTRLLPLALKWKLEEGVSDAFRPELRAVWVAV